MQSRYRNEMISLPQRRCASRPSRTGVLDRIHEKASHVVEVYQHWAQTCPDRNAYVFLGDNGARQDRTCLQMDAWARAIAASLQRRGLAGERALLVFEPGLEYVAALIGCLYAGVTAVPAYPPDPMRIQRTFSRLQRIVDDCRARVMLTTSDMAGRIHGLLPQVPRLDNVIRIDEIDTNEARYWSHPQIEPASLALVQYTSGSTGTPKGVMISHANLLANLKQIHQKVDHPDNVCVSWLPAYHDMGLISILQLWFSCRPLVMMSPLSFFQKPIRWLQAITDFRATVSPSPNFGYDLCVRKIDPAGCEALDLSSWTRALNGAEPLRPDTIERFCTTFAKCGMRRESFLPAYGMAETTLMIAGGEPLEGAPAWSFDAAALRQGRAEARPEKSPGSRTLICCGQPVADLRLRIVDPDTGRRLPENQVGEIWVSGPNVGAGYWGNAEETERTFRARTQAGEGPFLRTGDMGFLRHGELFITGRCKELIIFCGKNHYPQDIERTVEQCHEELKAYGGAVFAVDDGQRERLVIVHEVARAKRVDVAALLELIRRRVGEEHQIPVDDIVLIRQGSLPKTSSGKTQRAACRDQYLAGQLNVVAQWKSERSVNGNGATVEAARQRTDEQDQTPRTETEKVLALIWSEVLGITRIGIHDDFFDLGGNSLLATQLIARIGQASPVPVGLSDFFLRPTIAAVGEMIDASSNSRAGGSVRPDLPPSWREGQRDPIDQPLSASQQRLWFLDRLDPGNSTYNVSAAIRIEGDVDPSVLERCFQTIILRHETLRTNFQSADGRPALHVNGQRPWSLAYDDCRNRDWESQLRTLKRLADEESRRPFDLGADWLLRARLVQLATRDFQLLLTMHHIVCDGWSMGVLQRELAALYPAIAANRPSPLPDLPLQFVDYAAWQRDWLGEGPLTGQLQYWREQLADAPPSLELPFDRPRPSVQTYRGGAVRHQLPGNLLQSLTSLGRTRRKTLFMVLLAAWQTLLHRLTGQDDIIVGTPIANRRLPEFESLIGFFANTLALRSDLSGDPTFHEFLDRVGATTLQAYEHQDLPFERLVDELGLQRDMSRSPLFQVMFVLQNAGGTAVEIDGLRVTDIELLHGGAAMFDLTLNVEQTADGLRLLAVFNSDLLDAATVRLMIESFEVLLRGIVANPDERLSVLPVLSESDKSRLTKWYGTEPDLPADDSILRRFSEQASSTPDAAALVMDDRMVTYRELDIVSSRLGNLLRERGIGRESLVGVHLNRSLEAVTALFGIWKAGAAYLPLDSSYPEARLQQMIEDAGAAAVITDSHLAERLPAGTDVLCLDRLEGDLARQPSTVQRAATTGDTLAYVLFTSGSTGRPKGVEITHGSLVNHAVHLADMQGLGPGDRVLQFLSLSFDASAEEIFPTLISGATLVLHPSPGATSGRELLDFTRERRIGVVHVPSPVSLQLLDAIAEAGPARCGHLKLFLTGGDALPPEKLRLWCDTLGHRAKLLFCYGTTEATITSTVYQAPATLPGSCSRVPIGRPIPNQRTYVLDSHLQPVPVGVCGELCLGGAGVGRGYRNRPEETALRFVPDPFSKRPGARMYRTGDLARFRADGQIEFLGRSDAQAKIHGYRVEPGEVESLLSEHPALREAAVVPRSAADGHKVLVAFYVPRDGQPVASRELRCWLKSRCPDYMIPARFAPLERLPQLPGGKIDRNALPEIPTILRENEEDYTAPRTRIERELAAIWAELLRINTVGVNDNFFQSGGDSILSIQMVARAQAAGITITAKDAFLHQTIAELAAAAADRPTSSLPPDEATGPLAVTPVQHRFLSRGMPDPHHFHQTVLLDLPSGWSSDTLRRGLQSLIDHHDALRLRGRWHNGQWQQEIVPAGEAIEMGELDLSHIASIEQERAVEDIALRMQEQLDLEHGPICRCMFFPAASAVRPRLLMVVHHFAVDAVSWRILLEDLQQACSAIHDERRNVLPPKTSSFRTWAERLIQYADSSSIQDEIAYWMAVNTLDSGRIPRDFAGGDNLSGSARTTRRHLTSEDTQILLQQVSVNCHLRPNEILLCALAQVLTNWTGRPQARIDVESHGREPLFDDVDLSRTVGWFTSVFPTVLRGMPSERNDELLRDNKALLRRIPRGGIGYGVLRWLTGDGATRARLAAAPLSDVAFNYLGQISAFRARENLLRLRRTAIGPMQSEQQPRPHLVEILAWIEDERLTLDVTWSAEFHRDTTMELIANDLLLAIRGLIRDASRDDALVTASVDFPLANIDDTELSALSAALERADQPG